MKKFRRWFTVLALVSLFFVLIISFAGCNVLDAVQSDDLQGAMLDNNRPGSGSWKPRIPQSGDQCRQFYSVMNDLSADTNKISTNIDDLYILCFDREGNLQPAADRDRCVAPMKEQLNDFSNHWVDFARGYTVYTENCATEDGDVLKEDAPTPPPTKPKVPENPPAPKDPKPKDTEGDDDEPGWYCLTCIHNIDINYIIYEGPIELPNS